jgi:hypothetical protein
MRSKNSSLDKHRTSANCINIARLRRVHGRNQPTRVPIPHPPGSHRIADAERLDCRGTRLRRDHAANVVEIE